LERQLAVAASPEAVWTLFWDVPALASCIPGCASARALDEPDRYAAVVEVRVGRFKVEFELAIEVVETVEGELIRARAQGRDRRTRSAMVSELQLRVRRGDVPGAQIALQNDLQVYGRLGSMGHNVIKRRSEDLMDEFAANLLARLSEPAQRAV
jgi:carbon monoxide dehydrogenase subunit G